MKLMRKNEKLLGSLDFVDPEEHIDKPRTQFKSLLSGKIERNVSW